MDIVCYLCNYMILFGPFNFFKSFFFFVAGNDFLDVVQQTVYCFEDKWFMKRHPQLIIGMKCHK